MRVKLAARGGGRWQSSGGYRSKFGLTVAEVRQGLEELKSYGMQDCFKLLHFHLGSQIPEHPHRQGRAERSGAHLRRARQGRRRARVPRRRRRPGRRLRRLADQLRVERQLHARGVRQRRRLPHPDGVRRRRREASDDRVGERPRDRRVPQRARVQRARRRRASAKRSCRRTAHGEELEQPLIDLKETYQNLTARNALESYHDAQQALDMALNLFNGGYLPLEQRCLAETLYWAICAKLRKLVAADGRSAGGSAGPRRHARRHVLLQLLAVPVDSGLVGDQAAVPGDADPPAERAADAAGRARRHHLRLGRQDRSVHRPPRREAHAGAAPVHRRAVLPRRVPGRRLPGDPRRPAQPVRRHARGARQPRRDGQRHARVGDQGRHRARGARLRRVRRRHARPASCATRSKPPSATAASTSRSPAGCCASTKTACTATPTSKIQASASAS